MLRRRHLRRLVSFLAFVKEDTEMRRAVFIGLPAAVVAAVVIAGAPGVGVGHSALAHGVVVGPGSGQSGVPMMGQGMGHGMMGQGMGHGMMGQGIGHGMMGGGTMPGGQGTTGRVTPDVHVTVEDARHFFGHQLTAWGNQRLKLGKVGEKDEDTITADIVTLDDSLVQRYAIDRHTGVVRAAN